MNTTLLLCVLLVNPLLADNYGFYLIIKVDILTENNLDIGFKNLVEGTEYLLNWTDNKNGLTFDFTPDETHSQTINVQLLKLSGTGSIQFELYDAEGFLESYLLPYDLTNLVTKKPFYIPIVTDIINIIATMKPEDFFILAILLTITLVVNFKVRGGK